MPIHILHPRPFRPARLCLTLCLLASVTPASAGFASTDGLPTVSSAIAVGEGMAKPTNLPEVTLPASTTSPVISSGGTPETQEAATKILRALPQDAPKRVETASATPLDKTLLAEVDPKDEPAPAVPPVFEGQMAGVLTKGPIPVKPEGAEDPPVNFMSEQISYDDANQMVVATGSVEFEQGGRILTAKRVVYDLTKDTVHAEGGVTLLEANGDVHFAENVDFTDDMKDGFVKSLKTTLADGSRFTAKTGKRVGGTKIVMRDATYTPCEPCKADPEKSPLWQLTADKVTHDSADKTIAYNNATFEMAGVPVFYTPYFSHPDGTEDQKSGFLAPSFQLTDELGLGVDAQYYWGISPSTDATIGSRVYTKQAPLGLLEVRHRFDDAEIEMAGSLTNSERPGFEEQGEDVRGHLFGEGLWNIDEKWRAGFNAEMSSDKQYLRQYDISSDRVLESDVYAERFSGRNYAVGRLLSFNDTRVRDIPIDQPDILPEMEMSFLGEPGGLLGGRWEAVTSFLGLRREGDDRDMVRASQELGWEGKKITSFGLVNTLNLNARGDSYHVTDLTTDPAADDSDNVSRLYTYAQLESGMPFEKPTDFGAVRIEPLAALTLSPNLNDDRVPNEDSQDTQIDASNIFEASRFPGYDRVEDNSHVTYGVRTGAYGGEGSMGEVFLGQSYSFDDNDLFPDGSGLEDQTSDIVGQISGRYRDKASLYYRFQVDADTYQSERHELDNNLEFGRLTLDSTYLYARALEGTDITESREQIKSMAGLMLADEWRARAGGVYDLGEDDGLRRSILGLDYLGQCLTLSLTAQRRLTLDETGEKDTEFFMRIGFKNLGEFGTGSSYSLNEQVDD